MSAPLDRFRQFDFRNSVIRSRDKVLHLGRADHEWLAYLSQVTGPGGLVLWIDRNPVSSELPPNVHYLREDITMCDVTTFKDYATLFDVITLDLVENAGGKNRIALGDERTDAAMEIVKSFLKRGGNLAFRLPDTKESMTFAENLKAEFTSIQNEVKAEDGFRYYAATDYKKL